MFIERGDGVSLTAQCNTARGGGGSAGFLGMTHAPFVVDSNGQIQNAKMGGLNRKRLTARLEMLDVVETNFINSKRGDSPKSHKDVYQSAVNLMTSEQMKAFRDRKSVV